MHCMDTGALGEERDQRGTSSPRSRQANPGSLSVQQEDRFTTKTCLSTIRDKPGNSEQRDGTAFPGSLHPRLPKGPRSTRGTTQLPGPGPTARSGPGRASGHGAGGRARPPPSFPRPPGTEERGSPPQPYRDVPGQPLQAAATLAPRPASSGARRAGQGGERESGGAVLGASPTRRQRDAPGCLFGSSSSPAPGREERCAGRFRPTLTAPLQAGFSINRGGSAPPPAAGGAPQAHGPRLPVRGGGGAGPAPRRGRCSTESEYA